MFCYKQNVKKKGEKKRAFLNNTIMDASRYIYMQPELFKLQGS